MNQTMPEFRGSAGGREHLEGCLPNHQYNAELPCFKIIYLYIKSTARSKNKKPDSDPIHSSMNQGHSQQDPQSSFSAEQIS